MSTNPQPEEIDRLVADLEQRKLGWSLDHTGNMIEARIWRWPVVIGRYRPATVEPLHQMLLAAGKDAGLEGKLWES